MQNYSSYFATALGEFVSPLCPAGTEDAAKGQVTMRAGYAINTGASANVGFIAKSAGQTQFAGVGVDALLDRGDGTGADFLTDVDAGNGMREVRLAFTAYAPPPPGTVLPPSNWVQPTTAHLAEPGPLVLKSGTPVPEPEPEPVPPVDSAQMDRIEAKLDALQLQLIDGFQEVIATDNANTEKVQTQLHDIVEDAEESLMKIAPILLGLLRAADDDSSGIDAMLAIRTALGPAVKKPGRKKK